MKTMLSTTQDSKKTIDDLLLDLLSTPIRPSMPFPQEILHNRTFQWPSKPSSLVSMERVWNFLSSRKKSEKTHFDQSHGAKELGPSQEVLLGPLPMMYVPGTIANNATEPCSYIMEAQGKHYHGTREHIRPIHLNIPIRKAPKQPPSKPKTQIPSHIP